MSILDIDSLGTGDAAVSELLPQSTDDFRLALRRKLMASRGSSYTYKDPDAAADRAGATIGDDGTISFTVRQSFNTERAGNFVNTNNAGNRIAGADGRSTGSYGGRGGANLYGNVPIGFSRAGSSPFTRYQQSLIST